MADVIRDVVVRISLQQIDAALKVPDIKPLKDAQSELKKLDMDRLKQAGDAALKASAEFRAAEQAKIDAAKAATEAAMKQAAAINEVKEASARQRQFIHEVAEANKQAAKEYEAQQKMKADADAKAAQAAEAAAAKQRAGTLKVLEVTGQLGEGTFQLARGFAFLATSTDDNFREMLATIAKFQGAFDLVKGGTVVIKGLMEGTVALKAATGAATVGAALFSTAIKGITVAAGVASTAIKGLIAATGPLGAIVLLIGAATAAWIAFSESSDNATESAKGLREELERQLKLRQDIRNIQDQSADERLGLLSDNKKIEEIGTRSVIRGGRDQLLANKQAKIEDFRDTEISNGGNSGIYDTILLDIAKQRSELARQDKEDQRVLYDLATRKADAQERELEKAKQVNEANIKGLETAREKLRVEESKLQSINAQFGALTKGEQEELKRLAEKVKAGEELNRRELERAERLGGNLTRDFVERQRARQGEAAGASDIGAAFGTNINAGVEAARQGISEAEALAAASQEAVTQQEKLLAVAREAQQQELTILNQLITTWEDMAIRLKELESIQEGNNALQQ